ncbi:Sec-independent protein translocase protein TatB [Segnochrobactraceae bacterium EtOH-i3]
MFEIGWTELVVVAVVAVLVVGPKDLPRMLRTFGQYVGKARRMASEFQTQFNDALKEAERQAEMEDLRKQVDALKTAATVAVDPIKAVKDEITKLGPTATSPLPSAPASPAPVAGPEVPAAPLPLVPTETAAAPAPAAPEARPAPVVEEGVTLSGPTAPAVTPPAATPEPAPVATPTDSPRSV